jgi:hypothetical protein
MEFLALIGNVNDSILKIEFGDGFHIEEMDMNEFAAICEEEFGLADVWPKLDYDWECCTGDRFLRPDNVYVIKKTRTDYPEYTGSSEDLDSKSDFWRIEHAYQDKLISYLEGQLRKLRLYKEGSIRLSLEIFYRIEKSHWEMDSSRESILACENRLFSLTEEEALQANKFLSKDNIESKHKYLKFAVENFEQSYSIAHQELEFLSLMISLEALLNDANSELRFRVSRGCAVLIGKTPSESKQIFKQVKELYDKRSILVHTGDKSKIKEIDVLNLKEIVRQALKKALFLNLPKAELSMALMESAFGSAK